jgi:hypothetical protein
MEAPERLSCCPGEGPIHAVNTRRVMDREEALPRLPQSDAGNLEILGYKRGDLHFRARKLNTAWAKEKKTPVLAA